MTLEKLLEIKKGDIVTVVGAGGKTSLITYLTKTYSSKNKVLLSTTTKIYLPKKSDYDNKIMSTNLSNTFIKEGVTLYGQYINNENKVMGVNFKELDVIIKDFDYSFIEGDGSKHKKLKGWNEYEPLVYPKTTKNIGILDISAYGMCINNRNIHRLDQFLKICGRNNGKINLENLKNVVLNKNGLFKNSVGEKILFINKVESKEKEEMAIKLISMIKNKDEDIKIVYGSLMTGMYKVG